MLKQLRTSRSLFGIEGKGFEDEVLGRRGNRVLEIWLFVEDVFEDAKGSLPNKRRLSVEQLVGHDSQRPNVHLFIIVFRLVNLRSHVLISAAESASLFSPRSFDRPAEVTQLGP